MAQKFLTGINIVGDALSISGNSVISSARHAAFVNLTTTGDTTLGNAVTDGMTINGNTTINTTGVTNNIMLVSTDTSASSAPDLVFYRNAGAPVDSDTSGLIEFRGRNAIGGGGADTADIPYGTIYSRMVDVSDQDSNLSFGVNKGNGSGALITAMLISPLGANNSATGAIIINPATAFTKPSYNLTVNGTSNITGNATFGGTITATTDGSSFGNISVDRINLADTEKIIWGGGSDLQIYHTSNVSYIFANNTFPLKIATETSGTPITIGHATSETTIGDNLTVIGSTTMAGVNPTSLTTPLIQLQSDLDILNKAQTAYLDFATRDTSGSEVVYNLSNIGTISSGNITTSGYLRGPASFTIDPASHGDNTGTVVIAGNLQVDGTTTTINSTTVAIDDLNFSIATDAADSAAANGAGITIGGAGATLTYVHADTGWAFNKGLKISDSTNDNVRIGTRGGNINIHSTNDAGANAPLRLEASQFNFITGNADFAGSVTAGSVTVEGGSLILGEANTASGHVNAYEVMTFNIDTDNDDTNRYFAWYTNGADGSGTELLKILETGAATFASTITTTDVYGASSLRLAALGGIAYLDSGSGSSVIIRTNGTTTALTLDSSQNATFVGDIISSGSSKSIKTFRRWYMDGNADFGINNAGGTSVLLITGGGTPSTSTATFAGNVTAASFTGGSATFDPVATIEYSDISTGENRGLRIINTSGTDQQWNITVGVTGSENESFCIRDATGDVNALIMTMASGNATFAGTIGSGAITSTAGIAGTTGTFSGAVTASAFTGTASNAALLDNIDSNQFAQYHNLTFVDGTESTSRTTTFPTASRTSNPDPEDYGRIFHTEFKSKAHVNSPGTGSSWLGIISMTPYVATSSSWYTTQIAMGADGTNADLYIRRGSQTTWGSWRQIITADSATFTDSIYMGNTVTNPASGFADQTGIGLKYSTTVPEIQVSSDSTAMQLGRTSTGGAGQILAMRAASTTVHNFQTTYYSTTGWVDAANYKIGGAQGSDGQVLTSTGSGVAWETATATFTGGTVANATTFSSDVTVSNGLYPDANDGAELGNGSLGFSAGHMGELHIDDYIYHKGDTNTYIYFTNDTQSFRTGGGDRMNINNTGVSVGGTVAGTYPFEVYGTGTVRAQLRCTNNSTSGIYFQVYNGGSMVGNGTIATQNNGDMKFFTGTSSEDVALTISAVNAATFTGAVYVGASAGDKEGRFQMKADMLGVDWTDGNWSEVWNSASTPGNKFNKAVLSIDTLRGGGATGGVVGLAFCPGWGGHQNWGIYSFNNSGGSYTQGDLAFVSQINDGTISEVLRLKPDKSATFAGNIITPGYVGRDGHNYITFATDNTVTTRVGDSHRTKMTTTALEPYADYSYNLGASGKRFNFGYFNNTVHISDGNLTSNAAQAWDFDQGANFTRTAAGDCAVKIKSTSGGDPTISLDSAAANRTGVINFMDNTAISGGIRYEHNGDSLIFYTAAVGSTHKELILKESEGATFRTSVTSGDSAHGRTLHGSKSVTLTENTFTTTLTVSMGNHTACYVKLFVTGDWSSHSSVQYLGEYFLTNGAGGYGEPGMIIREVDNTVTDTIEGKIVDPSGTSGNRDFIIQLKANDTIGASNVGAKVVYEVMGQYVSVS